MTTAKADIIAQLQKDIFSLQGLSNKMHKGLADIQLGPIQAAFPGNTFPVGAMHEFIMDSQEETAVTTGFIAGLLASLMKDSGIAIWIGSCRKIFPPALQFFGIAPDRMIYVDVKKEKEILWAMEEALRCEGLAAVIGEVPELGFTASRRLQLAVEQSRVTGFILRYQPKRVATTACVTRWKINALPGALEAGLPGVGFPRWNVQLLKVRNGKPGSWQMEFSGGRFHGVPTMKLIPVVQQKKTG